MQNFDFGSFIVVALAGYGAGMLMSVLVAVVRLAITRQQDLFGYGFGKLFEGLFYGVYILKVQIPKILIALVVAAGTLAHYQGALQSAVVATSLICAVVAAVCLQWYVTVKR